MPPINQAFPHNRDIYHIVGKGPASASVEGGGLNLQHQLPMPAPKRLSYLDKGISVTDIGGGEGTPSA